MVHRQHGLQIGRLDMHRRTDPTNHLFLLLHELAVRIRQLDKHVDNLQTRGIIDVLADLPRYGNRIDIGLQQGFKHLQRLFRTLFSVDLQQEGFDIIDLGLQHTPVCLHYAGNQHQDRYIHIAGRRLRARRTRLRTRIATCI